MPAAGWRNHELLLTSGTGGTQGYFSPGRNKGFQFLPIYHLVTPPRSRRLSLLIPICLLETSPVLHYTAYTCTGKIAPYAFTLLKA